MILSAPSRYRLFVGIDIAATSATAAWMEPQARPTRVITIPQTSAGYAGLQQRLLATTLATAGFAVSVINPTQASDFAKALLKRAKTDAIDAQTLAELGARLQPEPWTPPPPVYTELHQRLMQRESLVQMRTQLRNQLHALRQYPKVISDVERRIETLLATIDEQIAEVEHELAVALRHDEVWSTAAARLQTINGIGHLTACWLLVTTLNFTLCRTPEEATSHAGLAPYVRWSGSSVRGKAQIGQAGNRHLRRALYLASVSATRYTPVIKAFYERLRAAGKPAKVARCAAARTLLHIAWAVVTKERDFDPQYAVRTVERRAA